MRLPLLLISLLCMLPVLGQGRVQTPPVLTTTSLSNPEDRFEHGNTGNYAKDDHNLRDEYVGEWEYNQNGTYFRIRLTKEDKVLNVVGDGSHYNFFDQLTIRYKLIKNGVTLFDNLTSGTVDPILNFSIIHIDEPLSGRMLDYTRYVIGSFNIRKQLTLNGPPKIFFNLYLGNYTMLNPPAYYQDGQPLFSIPTGGIEMVKVN